ncbi:nicotinate-nicotinamide nucleotide adenylyltransferase [Aurantimonas sp. Leaf443]|nr:nicotinate-nicotinamide nucleotide adenylyltransferase [Aurantimonas sp. Leaf443]
MAGLSPQALSLPPAGRGQAIGLFGGSFDPPHAGHLLVAETARRRLSLDAVWWLVTPGNPLKRRGTAATLAERHASVLALAGGPGTRVTSFEAAQGLRYTAETLAYLRARRPDLDFVWIMGADSLASFHRWRDFRSIAQAMPIAVVDRPGSTFAVLSAPAAQALSRFRLPERRARALPGLTPPVFTVLHGPRSATSSTALRKSRMMRPSIAS